MLKAKTSGDERSETKPVDTPDRLIRFDFSDAGIRPDESRLCRHVRHFGARGYDASATKAPRNIYA